MALRFKIFADFPRLKYGLSDKADGPMELPAWGLAMPENRLNFYSKQHIDKFNIISAKQSHSSHAQKIAGTGAQIVTADGLMTAEKDIILTVTVADCYPVYFFDPKKEVVGIAHCGWRGILGGLIGNMLTAAGSSPADVLVGSGPGVGPCHFEVQNDVLPKFKDYPEVINTRYGKTFIDLPKIIGLQLSAAGIPLTNIEFCGECTFCEAEKYFSVRRDKPGRVLAMLGVIGLLRG